MIEVQASFIGADIPVSPFKGAVEMVFAHACTFMFADGRRLSLLCGEDEKGMRIATIPASEWRWLQPHLQVGAPVTGNANGADGPEFKIDWSQAQIWQSPEFPGYVPADGWGPGLKEAHICLEQAMAKIMPSDAWTMAHERFADLCEVLARKESPDGAVLKLIGLGPGLTPSGDDMLCGLLGAFAAAGDARFDGVRQVVEANLERTTSASIDYLSQACQPWWTEALHDLFAAVTAPATGRDMAHVFARLSERGHSSGIDQAAGLIAGLALAAETAGFPSTPHQAGRPVMGSA